MDGDELERCYAVIKCEDEIVMEAFTPNKVVAMVKVFLKSHPCSLSVKTPSSLSHGGIEAKGSMSDLGSEGCQRQR